MSTDLRDDELLDRLRRMAREDTSGAPPWPAFTTVVRRSHRRRALGAATLVSSVWLVAAGVVAVTQEGEQRALPAATPAPSGSVSLPEPTGSLGPFVDRRRPGAVVPPPPVGIGATAGSLATDTALLDDVRAQIAAQQFADGPEQVHVLWAGQVDGRRFALTAAPAPEFDGSGGMEWLLQAWRLDGGLRAGEQSQPLPSGTDLRTLTSSFLLVPDPDRTPLQGGVRIVLAPTARQVDVGSLPVYTAAGGKQRAFVPLRKEGPVWVGHETWPQLQARFQRVTAADGKRRLIQGGVVWADSPAALPDLRPVSPPGSDPALLECATRSQGLQRGLDEGRPEAVLGATQGSAGPQLAPSATPSPGRPATGSALGVLRVGGAYLVTGCVLAVGESGHDTFVMPVPDGGPAELAALLPLRDQATGRRWAVVVAPTGAATAEVAGRTAQVENRLATVELPAGAPPDRDLQATIRRADGSVLTTAAPAARDRDLDAAYLDELPPGP